jgi:hypothetical protein
MKPRLSLPAVSLCTVMLLAGCGVTSFQSMVATQSAGGTGRVMGGQQPVTGSTIQLYAVGTGGDGSAAAPLLSKTVTTDSRGNFNISNLYTCVPGTLVYITATGGNPGGGVNPNLSLMAAIGTCDQLGPDSYLSINEVTTVAAVAALYPYMSSYAAVGSSTSDSGGLAFGFATAAEFAAISTGVSPGTVPSGDTVPSAEINTLADVVSACINSQGGVSGDGSPCGNFFFLTKPGRGAAATDTIGALIDLNYTPAQNTHSLYVLIPEKPPFYPIVPPFPSTFAIELIAPALPGLLHLDASTYTVNEDAGSVTIQVDRSGGSAGAVSVHYGTSNGTAVAGTDYTAKSGTLSWADGDASAKTMSVSILDQSLTSGTKAFQLALTAATGGAAVAAPGSATVTISDEDGPITLQLSAAADATVENASWLTLQATRTGSSSGAVTAMYATADGTGAAGTAYGSTSGVVSWADEDRSPKLFTIPILDQLLTSGSQTFTVTLSAPTGGAALGSVGTETVTISDKDPAYVDYCHPNSPGTDTTATYCTTMNWPTFGTPTLPLPPNPTAVPGDGLTLSSNATNLLSLVMGTGVPGANMVSGQSIRSTFFLNYIFGNLNTPFGSPQDTGQANNSTFAAVARHYEVGDVNDTDLMSTDGVHLRAFCSENRTNCTPGNVFAGFIRVPAEIRPGMTIEVRYKSPAGNYSWAPTWLFTGSQYSPGPGGNPYANFETNTSLLHYGASGDAFEIDLNDNYPRWNNNPTVSEGKQVDYGFVNNSGVQWIVQPHYVYWATGSGYTYETNTFPAFEAVPFDWASGFHDLVLSWDTDNLQYEFVDGNLIAVSYMEYPATTYTDGLDGNVVKQLAMNLMIGNQAIPSFTPGHASTTDNDGIPDGWTIVVQEISVWNGTVADPYSHQIAPNGCTACQ